MEAKLQLCPNCRWPQIDAEVCPTCTQPIKHRCKCTSPAAQPRLAGRYPRAEHEHDHDNQVTDCAFCQHHRIMEEIREKRKEKENEKNTACSVRTLNRSDGWYEALGWVERLMNGSDLGI